MLFLVWGQKGEGPSLSNSQSYPHENLGDQRVRLLASYGVRQVRTFLPPCSPLSHTLILAGSESVINEVGRTGSELKNSNSTPWSPAAAPAPGPSCEHAEAKTVGEV